MAGRQIGVLAVGAMLFLASSAGRAEENFKNKMGPIRVGEVTQKDPLQVPYIFWGGDMATFYANGGLTTKPGSIYQKLGLNLKLAPGDNTAQQIQDYMSGKSPFFRQVFTIGGGLASEVFGSDPRTKGVCIMQMTWSNGDHLVVRENIKSAADLKGKTIAVNRDGPHVGLVDDILKTANLKWDDIKIVWTDDITGPKGPAEAFRKTASIDGCCVVTPDMAALTGGLKNVGTGAEGSVKGARVLVSTAELTRSIADVYICRKDFYDANRDLVTKFVAGYLKAAEELIDLKNEYATKKSPKYTELLTLTQTIYGKDAIPTLDDAHGLLTDAQFVGYAGNLAFFNDDKNLHGFDALQKAALDLAMGRGYVATRCALFKPDFDWNAPTFVAYLTKLKGAGGATFDPTRIRPEIEAFEREGGLDNQSIISFTINFEPNQQTFNVEQYGAEFQRAIESADKFGRAVIVVRGHTDPSKTVGLLITALMNSGRMKRSGSSATGWTYSLDGKPFDKANVKEACRLIESGELDQFFPSNPQDNPRLVLQQAVNDSLGRAEAVKKAILAEAAKRGVKIPDEQFQAVGVGIRDPFIAKPKDMAEAKQNMRVEFRMIRVSSEAVKATDFDY